MHSTPRERPPSADAAGRGASSQPERGAGGPYALRAPAHTARPLWEIGRVNGVGSAPQEAELEPDPGGGAPSDPDRGAPGRGPELEPEPLLPMSGQLCVEPELDELDPEVPELDDGADVDELGVDESDVEPVPELPVEPVVEVVAALATSAPPATRPEVSAPIASTLRKRNGMGTIPFGVCGRPTQAGTTERAPRVCVSPYTDVGQGTGFADESMTILRRRARCSDSSRLAHRRSNARAQHSRTPHPPDQVNACSRASSRSAWARRSHPGRRSPRASRGSASWRRDAVAGWPRPC